MKDENMILYKNRSYRATQIWRLIDDLRSNSVRVTINSYPGERYQIYSGEHFWVGIELKGTKRQPYRAHTRTGKTPFQALTRAMRAAKLK